MADVVREIEITAALSSDYQAAFKAASSIARDSAAELAQLTKREQGLNRLVELSAKQAQASADGNAKEAAKLTRQYERLARQLGVTDRSASALSSELRSIAERRRGIEALNRSASRSAEIGRLARQIREYESATSRLRDPAMLAHLNRLRGRFRELGGALPDRRRVGMLTQLREGLRGLPGPAGQAASSLDSMVAVFRSPAALLAGSVAAIAAVAAAAVGATKALWDMGMETIKLGDQTAKTSRQLGIDAQAYQEFAWAVGLGGASEQDLASGLQTLNKQMEAARTGNKKAIKAFGELGISMQDVKRMNTEEMFVRISDALAEVDDAAEKTRTTMQLFGGSGTKLATAISGGSAELERLREEAREMGFVLDDAALKKAEEATDNYSRATMQLQAVKNEIGVAVMPAINDVLVNFSSALKDNSGAIKEFAEDLGSATTGIVHFVSDNTQEVLSALMTISGPITTFLDTSFNLYRVLKQNGAAIGDFASGVADSLAAAGRAIADWWQGLADSASAWVSSIIDDVARTLTGGLTALGQTLQGIPVVGRLFSDDGTPLQAATGGVTVQVTNSVDARGAAPGAGVDVARALQTVSGGISGALISGAVKQFKELAYD